MSTFTPTATLFYLEGSNPVNYGIVVSCVETTQYSIISISEAKVHEEDENGYIIRVLVNTGSRGSNELEKDLGTITLHPTLGFIEIEYFKNANLLGKKRVKTEEAQKESRPIDELNL